MPTNKRQGDGHDGEKTRKKPRTRGEGPTPVILRHLEATPDYFWKTAIAHPNVRIFDRNLDSTLRQLPQNEIVAMALNEIACHFGRGFFYYLPSRATWRVPKREPLLPAGRVPPTPGAAYPTLLEMDFVWDKNAQTSFLTESQRGRHLKCNALLNPPAASTPCYAVQFCGSARFELYMTLQASLILIQSSCDFYLLSTLQLESIVSRWTKAKKTKPLGPDPELRLNNFPYLFNSAEMTNRTRDQYAALQAYRQVQIEDVYKMIISRCRYPTGDLKATFDAHHLRTLLPRGPAPSMGVGLGIAVTGEEDPLASTFDESGSLSAREEEQMLDQSAEEEPEVRYFEENDEELYED